MKILHLSEVLGVGGLPNYVLALARLQQEKHPVTIAHMSDTVGKALEVEGLNIVRIRTLDDIKALKPDIIHVHLLSNDLDLLKGLFTLNVPLVRFFHDYTSTCLRRGKRRWKGDRCQRPLDLSCAAFGCLVRPPAPGAKMPEFMNIFNKITERDLYRKFDAAVVGSRHMNRMLIINGFDAARVHTIPYFTRFAEQAADYKPRPPGIGTTRPVEILFSGQAVYGKGLEILIEAMHGVEGNWRLTVFSEGARLHSAKAIAAKYGLTDKISFRGWVAQSELQGAYRNADVFTLPSIWDDPGPLVGIEAMAFGTPVIGFAVGGIPDYVLDGDTGYLVKDTTIAGLRRAMQACMQNPQRLTALGINAQRRVFERHNSPLHNEGMYGIYDSVLKKENGMTRFLQAYREYAKIPATHRAELMSIQWLRGLAVVMVMLVHFEDVAVLMPGLHDFKSFWRIFCCSAPDLFFVISGFIMSYVTFGMRFEPRKWLFSRFVRIYPLYMFFTSLAIAVWMVNPSMTMGSGQQTWATALQALFIIPQAGLPIVFVGWTVEHEIVFYSLVFAIATLGGKARALVTVMSVLCALSILRYAGFAPWLGFWDFHFLSMMMVEFLFGAMIFLFRQRLGTYGYIVPGLVGIALFLYGGTYVDLGFINSETLSRVTVFGIAYGSILVAAVNYEAVLRVKRGDAYPPKRRPLMVQIGDASYSLYLLHPFLLSSGSKILKLLPIEGSVAAAGVAILGVGTIYAGLLFYKLVENPFLQLMKDVMGKKKAAKAAAVA